MSALPPAYIGRSPSPPDFHSPPAIEQLPSYEPEGSGDHGTFIPSQGIDDKLPNHFRIGKEYCTPLVHCSDLQAHLILLGAFHRLKEEVYSHKGSQDVLQTPDERWAVFLARAVHRFERWVTRMMGEDGESVDATATHPLLPMQVPPLDVIIVWHSYMLNPRTYYEDCLRKFPGLIRLGYVFVSLTWPRVNIAIGPSHSGSYARRLIRRRSFRILRQLHERQHSAHSRVSRLLRISQQRQSMS